MRIARMGTHWGLKDESGYYFGTVLARRSKPRDQSFVFWEPGAKFSVGYSITSLQVTDSEGRQFRLRLK